MAAASVERRGKGGITKKKFGRLGEKGFCLIGNVLSNIWEV